MKQPINGKLQHVILVLILVVLVITGCFHGKKIQISNQITKEYYRTEPIQHGDILSFEWEHSFEHILWKEFYRITECNTFELYTIAVQGFGAGIPAEMDCTYRYENGFIYMEHIKGSSFHEFNWIHSKKQLKKIVLNDTVLIRGEDLPERGRIRLSLK